jgi:Fur family ferric uptake transcriptional regulator
MNKSPETSQLGQRQTRQRDAIFQVIEKTSGPLAVEEIHQRAKKKLPRLGIATVYRALKLMLEARQVQQINMPSGETRYESAHLGHHDHFQCRLCHKVFDLNVCPLKLKPGAALPGGFVVEDHEMTLFGLCSKCSGKKA